MSEQDFASLPLAVPTWTEMLAALAAPFDPGEISWKPGATYPRDNPNRALALAYVDSRAYMERLNQVCAGSWSDHYSPTFFEDRIYVTCNLTIFGVTRCDVGEESMGDNAYTTACAQAFKRTCVKFGLGAYLYSFPQEWAEYDNQKRRFSDEGNRKLHNMAIEWTKRFTQEEPPPVDTESYLQFAAMMSTSKGTNLGDCTADQLQMVIDAKKVSHKLKEGAKALLDYLTDLEAKSDATYNKLNK